MTVTAALSHLESACVQFWTCGFLGDTGNYSMVTIEQFLLFHAVLHFHEHVKDMRFESRHP